MPVLEPVSDDAASQPAKEILEGVQKKIGMVPNFFRTLAHAPEVLDASMAFNRSFQKGLDAKLRELAYLKVSLINECHY